MKLRLDIFPPAQRAFWDEHAGSLPPGWVLYGGTAIALRYGHRTSVDFEFFSDRELDEEALRRSVEPLRDGTVLARRPDTLTVAAPVGDGEVRLSFFGTIGFGRVGEPDQPPGKFPLASPLDLLATKLKALIQSIEARDYLDVEVLLRSGLTLNQGIAAAQALFPDHVNPLDIAKAVDWFKEGDPDPVHPNAVDAKGRGGQPRGAAVIEPGVANHQVAHNGRVSRPRLPPGRLSSSRRRGRP